MCLDFWAQDFTSKIEINICAYEVKIRAYEVKSFAYEVKIRAYEVQISAYEVKSFAHKSKQGSLPREVNSWSTGDTRDMIQKFSDEFCLVEVKDVEAYH